MKLFVTFLLLTTLPLTITGYVTYQNMAKTLNDKLDRDTQLMMDQKLNSLTLYAKDLQRMGSSISQSAIVSDFLKNTSKDTYPSFFKKLDELIESIHAIRPENVGITIVNENGFIYNFGYTMSGRNVNFYKYEWLPPWGAYSDAAHFTPLHRRPYVTVKEDQPVFSFARQIISNNLKAKGLLIIDFHIDVLNQLFDTTNVDEHMSNGEDSGIFVTDQNDVILYPFSHPFFTTKDLQETNNASRMIKNDKYYKLIHQRDPVTGWTLSAYFLEDTLYAPVYHIRNSTISTTIITIFICLFSSFFISRNISTPLRRMKELMRQFGRGDFNLHFEIERKDEIGALGVGFNQMVKRIKELINLVYKEQNDKRKAEVTALQSQINPHFLYNTLESINSLARKNKEPEISKMIVLLGKLLRMSISTFDDMVRIENELEYVRCYLEIHKFRLQRPIDYEITLDSEIRNLYTVKWILQPIIENAVIHGLDPKQHGGSIKITGWMVEDDVYIQIADQGVGVTNEQLQMMRFQLQHQAEHFTKHEKRIGLYNVQSRIQLHCGEAYGIYLDSVLNEGMTVTVKLPRRTTNESL